MQAKDLNKLFGTLKSQEQADDVAVKNAVEGLSGAQKAKLDEILSSPAKMKAVLQSDTARELMKKLGKQGE